MRVRTVALLVAVVAGVSMLAVGWSYPVSTCVEGTGMERQCRSSTRSLLHASVVSVLGLGTALGALYGLFRTRRSRA